MNPDDLGARIQSARLAAGLTQQQLCEAIGISYSTLAKIERGAIKSPSIFTVQQICQGVGKTLEQLLVGEGTVAAPTSVVAASQPPAPKFVYSDINGVLVRYYQRAFVSLAHEINRGVEEVERVFWRFNDAVCRGELSEAELDANLAEGLGVKQVMWRAHYIGAVEPILETQAFLADLAKQLPTGLLSNIFPGYVEALLAAGKVPRLPFKAIVDSSKEHAIKPSRKIYTVAEERSGVKGSEILFLDDTLANIEAAKELGWQTVLFDSMRPEESLREAKQLLKLA